MTDTPPHASPPMNVPTAAVASSVRCARCGYDLTGSAVGGTCPECGVRVTHSLKAGGHTATNEPVSGYAIAALVLGILTLVGCSMWGLPSIITGPLALVFAHLAKGQVARGEAGGSSLSLAKAGAVCAWIGMALAALALATLAALFVLPVVFAALAA